MTTCWWWIASLWCLWLLRSAFSISTDEKLPQSWSTNPVARHVACSVDANTPTVCQLEGHEDGKLVLNFSIHTLPKAGLLYETSPNFRTYGSDPKHAPDPIGPHQLPFLITDPLHRLVYVPPFNQWPSEGYWSSFIYRVFTQDSYPALMSEEGMVVLANPTGAIAGSTFDVAEEGVGWSISGNLADEKMAGGLKHQPFLLGALSHYVYGVDEVQFLDFDTGLDRTKWYFEASPAQFHRPELRAAYDGRLTFNVRSLYGNFSELNSPLDWVTLECASCDSGRGIRLVRFVDHSFFWDGSERTVDIRLGPYDWWQRDPLNAALNFTYATDCEIAATLTDVSRIAILGDFTRGGEGVAIDDVAITMAHPSEQPTYPVHCQKGCYCKHNPGLIRPTCC